MATIDSTTLASLAHGFVLHEVIAPRRYVSVHRDPAGPNRWLVYADGPESALLSLAPDLSIVRADRGDGSAARSDILASASAALALVDRVRAALVGAP